MRALAVLLLLLPTLAHANPLDAFGFGARGMALGSAMTAVSEDYAANYYNPAGLAAGGRLSLAVGYAFVQPRLAIAGGDQDVDASRGIQAGVVLPGTVWGHRLGVSVGLHLPDERVSRIRALPQRQPRWVLWDNRPQRIVISSSAAFEVLPNLFLGGGLTYLANTSGVLDIEGQVSLTDAERTRLFSAVDVDLASVRYWTVGARYDLSDRWRFGAVWRQDFSLRLDLDVKVQGAITLGPADAVVVPEGLFLFNSANDNLSSPMQAVAGVAYQGDGWMVAADLGWVRWSAFPTPTASVDLELDLGTLDFDVPLPDAPLDPDFHDIVVPRVGGEWQAVGGAWGDLTVRAGYFYEPSPAPDQPGDTNYVDSDKHGAAFGLGLRLADPSGVFPRPVRLDLAGQYVRLIERRYQKTDPADPIGDYDAAGDSLGFAAELGFEF